MDSREILARLVAFPTVSSASNLELVGFVREILGGAGIPARVVTDRGIWVCPILLDAPDGGLGDDLAAAAARPFRLSHGACTTCWMHGAVCANPGAAVPEAGMPAEGP